MTQILRIAIGLFVTALLVAGCGSAKDAKPSPSPSKSDSTTAAASDCVYPKDGSKAARKAPTPPSTLPDDAPSAMTLQTNHGNINISFDTDQTPCTVNNFISLANSGYFDDTKCHRLVDNAPGQTDGTLFVLQCGDPSATGQGGPGYSFADELIDNDPRVQPCEDYQGTSVCTYTQGTVAMANAGPDTNGSQFFLVFKNSRLPNSYTVFGHMDAAGVRVVEKIAKGGFDAANPNTPPNTETIIESVS
ncbi:MAG TPA: peptidylprolyl isomerase [Marmoricola sp.]|nr:peptidylprolyl isomerase [Nocardioidaceae bacterium]MCO5323613.1 peptidylprolyl isomerase [Nocardioidaceae bacterium]HRV67836.1 peptidylprolyl isomerase [Marmoricola sp.]